MKKIQTRKSINTAINHPLDNLSSDACPLSSTCASSVAAIRSLRLAKQGLDEAGLEADLFSAGFISGDIQQRLGQL